MQSSIIFLFIFKYRKICKPVNMRHRIWKSRDLRLIHRSIPGISSCSRTHLDNNEVTKKVFKLLVLEKWSRHENSKPLDSSTLEFQENDFNLFVPDHCSPLAIRSKLCRTPRENESFIPRQRCQYVILHFLSILLIFSQENGMVIFPK